MLICPSQLLLVIIFLGIILLPSFFIWKLSVCFCLKCSFCHGVIDTFSLFNQINNICLLIGQFSLYTFILTIHLTFYPLIVWFFLVAHFLWFPHSFFLLFQNIELFVCAFIPESSPSVLLGGGLLQVTEGSALLYPGSGQSSPLWPLPVLSLSFVPCPPRVACGPSDRPSGNWQWCTGPTPAQMLS